MLANILAIKFMDSASTILPMAIATRVLGTKVRSKAMECTLSEMVIRNAVNGTLVPSRALYPH